MAEFAFERRESFRKRDGIFGEVHENETFPECQPDRVERMFRFIEAIDIVHMGRAHQRSIQPIGPGVIRALDGVGELARSLFAHSRSTMTADIVERMDLAFLVTDNDQTLSRNICEQILAWLFQLALMPHAKPFRRKDALSFFGEDFVGDEIFLRESFRTRSERFDSFVKGGHEVRSFAQRNAR